jgi:DNA-binding NarL/FixJ family response regulator
MRLILIDIDHVRSESLEEMLRFHDVHMASDAESALAALSDGHAVDAVVCDLRVPGLDGPSFHAAVARMRPDLAARVVFLADEESATRVAAFLATKRSVRPPFSKVDVERALLPFDPLPLI